jgi:Asp/Glu/hydantoin racemase
LRILLINPNTSAFVTEACAAEARRHVAPGTDIVAVTASRGVPIIGCRTENAIGAAMTVELAAEHAEGCDAVVLAVSFDSGLAAVRELLSIPVVGMSEAAMLTACLLGSRFAYLTFGSRAVPLYEELIQSYGLERRSAGVVALPMLSPAELRDPAQVAPLLLQAVGQAVAERGAESVVLGGAVFAGMAERLKHEAPVPLVDGIAAAVRLAEMLAATRFAKPTAGSYRLPTKKPIAGIAEAIMRLYGRLPEA